MLLVLVEAEVVVTLFVSDVLVVVTTEDVCVVGDVVSTVLVLKEE
jgi:hypothetical protein